MTWSDVLLTIVVILATLVCIYLLIDSFTSERTHQISWIELFIVWYAMSFDEREEALKKLREIERQREGKK
jgi:hypothetical protein